jgi:tRNA-Thr(GGU) m(6)t(6)A37 methyltransferase TsaA
MNEICLRPIGQIHSPYKNTQDIPIQGVLNHNVTAWVELYDPFVEGLRDLGGFSHAYFIYYFHRSKREELVACPYIEDKPHGIFAIRSPHRPNHLGLTIVHLKNIEDNKITFTGVDMLDGTPLLDIKPYVNYFDHREKVVSGWLESHIRNGTIPPRCSPR